MTKTPQELADFLTNYNRWRRGSYLHEQPAPTELGQVLDQVIAILEELNTNKTTILNTVLSDCCEVPAVVAGKPGSTQWHVCPECCQPCDVYYQDNTTQL
jgi:hypothetical protein